VRWQTAVTTSRGTNEVERLVDLVGGVSREGNSVCARAFGAAVGCVDAAAGQTVWSKAAEGTQGIHGDERIVVGSESDGRVLAWQRVNGERAWDVSRFKYRNLTSPLVLGRVVVVGDSNGFVHVLSAEDGSDMTRLSTDGSGIAGAPVVAGQNMVVQTRQGALYAWRAP
jgi:outer membrane protein assembly factor BamB